MRIASTTLATLAFVFALTTTAASAAPADDAGALLKTLSDAFNKGDAKAAAVLWVEDGDVITPAGVQGKGRAGVEKALAGDIAGILKGTTSKITVENVRDLGNGVWFVDTTHEGSNMKMPDGKTGTGKLHVVFVMSKGKDGKLAIVAARPYMFIPAPPAPPVK